MSYQIIETSALEGAPVELYEFRYGDAADQIFRFTSADHDVDIGGAVYTSLPLERDGLSEDGNPDDGATLVLLLPRDNPFADMYRIQPFEKTVTVKLRVTHLGDPDAQILTLWSGRVTGVSWEWPDMKIGCERVSTSLKRTGARARYQRQCRHVHFQVGCYLDRAAWAVPATVDTIIDPVTFDVTFGAPVPEGPYFLGGYLDIDGVTRYITGQAGGRLTISRTMPDLTAGSTLTLYPGCDRSHSTCKLKFNNELNYGGFNYIPAKGPFEGNPLV